MRNCYKRSREVKYDTAPENRRKGALSSTAMRGSRRLHPACPGRNRLARTCARQIFICETGTWFHGALIVSFSCRRDFVSL